MRRGIGRGKAHGLVFVCLNPPNRSQILCGVCSTVARELKSPRPRRPESLDAAIAGSPCRFMLSCPYTIQASSSQRGGPSYTPLFSLSLSMIVVQLLAILMPGRTICRRLDHGG